ncbi:MAG: prenyltransferase [Methanomassiliicoccales archaeon]|nr:MAG: prenyltransferase [Methanomassiliicoccales archaeon]
MDGNRTMNIIKLGRLHFVAGGFLLFLLGALFAMISGADFSLLKFLLGYAVLFPAHLSVSYSNDYFDCDSDIHNRPTFFTGGSGILVEHPELRPFAKKFAIFLIFLSILLSSVFMVIYSFPVIFFIFVVFGNVLGWFYAAPPVRLSYRRMGELATVLTAGILLPGMGYFVMRGAIDLFYLLFGIPLMLYGMAFILSVEIPDAEGDRLGNKRTMIVRKGRALGFKIVALCFLLCTIYFLSLFLLFPSAKEFGFLIIGLLSLLPLSIGFWGLLRKPRESAEASKLANRGVAALFTFMFLVDIYYVFTLV